MFLNQPEDSLKTEKEKQRTLLFGDKTFKSTHFSHAKNIKQKTQATEVCQPTAHVYMETCTKTHIQSAGIVGFGQFGIKSVSQVSLEQECVCVCVCV